MHTEQKNSLTIIMPAETEGATVNAFNEELRALIKRSPTEIIINCERLGRPISKNIFTLWRAYQDCRESGIAARLDNVSSQLTRILVAMDLYDLMISPGSEKISAYAGSEGEIFILESIPDEFCIEFHPDIDGINSSMNEFKEYLVRLEIPNVLLYDLITVFYEIATNIGSYSQLEICDQVSFKAVPALDKIRLDFEYPGIEFDPRTLKTEFNPQKAILVRQDHGLGLILVKKIIDSIIYDRINKERNLLTLEKRWN